MESVESPLDVLSRAATMVQDSLPLTNGNTSPDENSKQTSTKQLPTTKWKRERRRLPEYSRKSDPKLSENMPPELQQQQHSPGSPVEGSGRTTCTTNGDSGDGTDQTATTPKANSKQDAPIDMSVRQRGLPPSYTQAISSPGYRPSVITQAPTPNSPSLPAAADLRPGIRNDLPSGISMCDPIIDEHFRRSLGKDYLMLFNNNKTPSEAAATVVKSPVINNRVITTSTTSNTNINTKSNVTARDLLDMDSAGLSVDDHFAKALGDTWLKLNQKESEIQQTNGTTEKSAVVSL